MGKYSLDQALSLPRTLFPVPLNSYLFVNDGVSAIAVELDDRAFNVLAGEALENSAGERLRSLRVITTGVAWRFLGDA